MAEAEVSGPKGESVAQGSGAFRAVVVRDGEVIWRCPHVHFTDHSAKACPVMRRVLAEPSLPAQ